MEINTIFETLPSYGKTIVRWGIFYNQERIFFFFSEELADITFGKSLQTIIVAMV